MAGKKTRKAAATKRGEGTKKLYTNTNTSQAPQPQIQVRSTMHPTTIAISMHGMDDHTESDMRPSKRLKPTITEGPTHIISQSARADLPKENAASVEEESSASKAAQTLPPELQQLQSSYEFTSVFIIPSSKIEKSVRKLLLTLEKFSFADLKSKPGVVVLSAKAAGAAKMVSIVEIAKGAIEKDRGKWYQYSRLHGEVTPLNQKPSKRTDRGKALSDWQTEQKRPREESSASSTMQEVEETKLGGEGDNEAEDAFETMGFARAREPNMTTEDHEARSKVRAVPIMTIYMSRVPVPGLKDVFGYVNIRYLFFEASAYRLPQRTDKCLTFQATSTELHYLPWVSQAKVPYYVQWTMAETPQGCRYTVSTMNVLASIARRCN